MASMEVMQTAQVNRSIRTIKAVRFITTRLITHLPLHTHKPTQELEYLCDASVISPQTLSDLLSQIPPQTALHAPISVGAVPTSSPAVGAPQPPTAAMNNVNLQNGQRNGNTYGNEKADGSYNNNTTNPPTASSLAPPPPAYNAAPPPQANWPPLAQATALYAYTSSDAGDLELQPNDHVAVTEYMNAEWWKGKNARTGIEGIFPRSYVKVNEDKAASSNGNSYGNAPLEVSGMGNGDGKAPGKGQEMGKKFGKKLGNAAIFGAGASIGGNIVNSIF